MPEITIDVPIEVTIEDRERLASTLDALANGSTVTLGEFGDQERSTSADTDAMLLFELADGVRR